MSNESNSQATDLLEASQVGELATIQRYVQDDGDARATVNLNDQLNAFLFSLQARVWTPLAEIKEAAQTLKENITKLSSEEISDELLRIQEAADSLLDLDSQKITDEVTGNSGTPETQVIKKDGAEVSSKTSFRKKSSEPVSSSKILVVDDSEISSDILKHSLEMEGHEVSLARDGEEAFDIIAKKDFDLILLDIQLPGMDGYEVLEKLKEDSRLRYIPVVMISGIDELQSVATCIELGAEDHLSKPFNPVLLRARIGASLEKKNLRDQEEVNHKRIKAEQRVSEKLLLNILPKPIANRLKAGESPIADFFDEATVMFADLVGFTELASRKPPAEIVKMLNEIFSSFDNLAFCYGLEKIKTIGDSYMVVGGVPKPNTQHAEAIAEMAFDIHRELQRFNKRRGANVEVRIGINTGPVVAGIIGKNKFIYDLWGDTVNIASRMESHGEPGRIQVAQGTYDALKDKFSFEEKGSIQVKGKGEMHVYLLNGRKENF